MSKGLVLPYIPHLAPPEHWNRDYLAVPPLSHLALGGALREAGYEVRLIDAKWEPDARRQVVEAFEMPERTFAREARAAFEREIEDDRSLRQRRREPR